MAATATAAAAPQRQQGRATPSPVPSTAKLAFFVPCLGGFRRQLQRFWNHLVLSAGPWSRVPAFDDFQGTMLVALRVYMHLHHGPAHYGPNHLATVSPMEARLTASALRVPRYVLGILRELARPMTLDAHLALVPYLPLATSDDGRGQGPAPPLGFKLRRDVQVGSMLEGLLGSGALVPLVEATERELSSGGGGGGGSLAPCPASVATDRGEMVIYAGHVLNDTTLFPQWRLAAVSILRPLRHDSRWLASCALPVAAAKSGGALGGDARFLRLEDVLELQACEEEEQQLAGGRGRGSSTQGLLEDGLGEAAEAPPLLQHLVSNVEADTPGYTVQVHSTLGADVWAPFPTDPAVVVEAVDNGDGRGRSGSSGSSTEAAKADGKTGPLAWLRRK